MLQLGLVDCEGYDVISVFRDKEGQTEDDSLADARNLLEGGPTGFQLQAARATFRKYVKAGNPQAAIKLLQKLDEQNQPLVPDRTELAALIAALHKKRAWRDSAPLMAEYLERFEEKADAVRLKLAQICVVELDRPLRALELLKDVDAASLSHEQKRLHQQLITDPFTVLELSGSYDVIARITGGGPSGQAGALRLAIARALNEIDRENNRPILKKAGFLTRDARVIERKKAGLKKARKAPQFSKR